MRYADLKTGVVYEFNTCANPKVFGSTQFGLMILNNIPRPAYPNDPFAQDNYQNITCQVWTYGRYHVPEGEAGATRATWLIRPARVAQPGTPAGNMCYVNGVNYLWPHIKEPVDQDLTFFLGENVGNKFSFKGIELADVMPQFYGELLKLCNNV